MQNRRDFLKMGIVGSAFLPTFANLTAKAEQKDSVGQGKAREINIGIVGFGSMGKILAYNFPVFSLICFRCLEFRSFGGTENS